MHRLLVIFLLIAGCGNSPGANGSSDGGVGTDAGSDGDLGSSDGGGLGGCTSPSSGPRIISPPTRVRMTSPRAASDGSSTMAIWSIYPDGGFLKNVWTQMKSGAVVASGDLPFQSDLVSARLFVFKGRYYLFHGGAKTLYGFDGTAWSMVPNFSGITAVAASATQILGVGGTAGVNAVLFDGTAATAPQKISNYNAGPVASTGTGFGIVTIEPTGGGAANLRFMTYDGTAWSAESTVANTTYPSGASSSALELAFSAGLWCVAGYGYVGSSPKAWVLSGGTWSSNMFTAKGPSTLLTDGRGTFLLTTHDGTASVYKGGTWTATQLASGLGSSGTLTAYGNGYAYLGNDYTYNATATFYDGTAWGTPVPVASGVYGRPLVSVSGAAMALVFDTKIVTYENGSFTQPFTVTPMLGSNSGSMTSVFHGSDLVAVYPGIGTLESRLRTQGVWGQPLTLPTTPVTGSVSGASFARASNGHRLAVMAQWDAGTVQPFAVEYDGCKWGTAVRLTGVTVGGFEVAAAGPTFLITSSAGVSQVFRWTGSGIAAAQNLGSSGLRVSSDGTTFVATWIESGNVMAATSRDGQTWTAPVQVEAGPGWSIVQLAGGPVGVLAVFYNAGRTPNTSARVWQAGTWSPAVSIAATTSTGTALGLECQSSAGNSSALVVCYGPSGSDSELFTDGAWSKVAIPSTIGSFGASFILGSDGSDYRIDYAQGSTLSSVLHAGTWTSPLNNPGSVIYLPRGVAGKAGTWTIIGLTAPTGDVVYMRATGSAGYDMATLTKLSTVGGYQNSFTGWPGNTDAIWLGVTPDLPRMPVLYAAPDL